LDIVIGTGDREIFGSGGETVNRKKGLKTSREGRKDIQDGVPFPWGRLWGCGAIGSTSIYEVTFLRFGCGVAVARAAGAVSALYVSCVLGFR
jgi:hypothetical protein